MKKNRMLLNLYFCGIAGTIQKVTKYKNSEMTKKLVYYRPVIKILSIKKFNNLKTFLSW